MKLGVKLSHEYYSYFPNSPLPPLISSHIVLTPHLEAMSFDLKKFFSICNSIAVITAALFYLLLADRWGCVCGSVSNYYSWEFTVMPIHRFNYVTINASEFNDEPPFTRLTGLGMRPMGLVWHKAANCSGRGPKRRNASVSSRICCSTIWWFCTTECRLRVALWTWRWVRSAPIWNPRCMSFNIYWAKCWSGCLTR